MNCMKDEEDDLINYIKDEKNGLMNCMKDKEDDLSDESCNVVELWED